jgi:predicted nucleotidyltransferase
MDEREFIIQKLKAYKQLVDSSFPVTIESCWLYGSYAKGNQKKYSDIDVAFVVNHLDDSYDFFHTEPLLWKLTRQIDDRIEPILVVRDTDYAGFINEIEQTDNRDEKIFSMFTLIDFFIRQSLRK